MAVHDTKFTRRGFLGMAAGAGLLATCAHGAGEGQATRRPNVIYAFSDEHRWQSMSFTEMPQVHTPNMARMASQGAQFSRCISNYPVCSPYRAMLQTGLWPYQQGVIDNGIPLDPSRMTVGRAFQQAGYHTGYIGKWHLGGERAEPFGYDESLIWNPGGAHWDKAQYYPADGGPVQPKGYDATLMTDQALAFIEKNKQDPFFLMLSWVPPHANFLDPPESKLALYPEGSLPRRPNTMETKVRPGQKEGVLTANDWAHYRGYHAHISAIDDELGRLMKALDDAGLSGDTILIYSSDHGSMFGSHGVGSKREPYEESIRVPFLVQGPCVATPGLDVKHLFGTIDIAPTLCGLAGVPVPDGFKGADYSPLLKGDKGPDPNSQFIMHIAKDHASGGQNHPAPLFRGVRSRRYTYAVFPEGGGLLFDDAEDPYQMRNGFDDPAMAGIRASHESMLRDWLRMASDPIVLPV